MRDYVGKNAKNVLPMLNVTDNITDKFPPSFVMTSTHDFLRACGEPMANLLKEKGVETIYKLYGEEDDERMEHVFHCDLRLKEALECNIEECDFFKAHIR